jgi:RNA polymerase sigma-70 factor, ECF subfamily
MDERERHRLFSDLVTRHQSQLYAYIFALVRNREDAEDLFQSVCVVLWRRFESFQPNSSFFSWARQTAIFVLRNSFKRKKPPACVNEELLDALAETTVDPRSDETDAYLAALRRCKDKLGDLDRQLLELRYAEGFNSRQIADQMGRPQQGVCNSLLRIRRWLFNCIQIEVAQQDRSVRDTHE